MYIVNNFGLWIRSFLYKEVFVLVSPYSFFCYLTYDNLQSFGWSFIISSICPLFRLLVFSATFTLP